MARDSLVIYGLVLVLRIFLVFQAGGCIICAKFTSLYG